MIKKGLAAAALVAIAAIALSGCAANTASTKTEKGLTRVNLTLPAPASLEGVAYDCVPLEAGFFKKEGLDVHVESADGSVPALQSLETGSSDAVVVGTAPLMSAIQSGSDVKAFATVVTGSYAYPAVLPDSPIKSFLDLQGKTIGVPSLQSGSIPFTQGLVALAGGDPKSLKFLPIGFGAEALAALKSKQIDALGLWDTAYVQINALGQPLRAIEDDKSKGLGFQVVYAAKSSWLDAHPDIATALTRAFAESYVYSVENPDAALQDCWKEYPDLIPTGVSNADAKKAGLAAIKARLGSSGPIDGLYGNASAAQVKFFYELQVAAGTVKAGIPADKLWTDAFIKKANDFDVSAVKKQADAAKK